MEGSFLHACVTCRWRQLLDYPDAPLPPPDVSSTEESPLLKQHAQVPAKSDEEQVMVYGRRWLVLLSFFLVVLANNFTTYTYSSATTKFAAYYNVRAVADVHISVTVFSFFLRHPPLCLEYHHG
jgi:hypothetical protein